MEIDFVYGACVARQLVEYSAWSCVPNVNKTISRPCSNFTAIWWPGTTQQVLKTNCLFTCRYCWWITDEQERKMWAFEFSFLALTEKYFIYLIMLKSRVFAITFSKWIVHTSFEHYKLYYWSVVCEFTYLFKIMLISLIYFYASFLWSEWTNVPDTD